MARSMSDSEWNAAHHAQAQNDLQQRLASAISLHAMFLGDPGFLSKDDILRLLIAAYAMVQLTPADDLREISSQANTLPRSPKRKSR